MAEEAVKRLEARIVELENQLAAIRARPEPSDISADEVQAYLKVRGMVADWGENCGINECARCIARLCGPCIRWPSETISRCVHTCGCIFECFCGPCNLGGFEGGGVSRFSALGR
jgi:hypothetical protein